MTNAVPGAAWRAGAVVAFGAALLTACTSSDGVQELEATGTEVSNGTSKAMFVVPGTDFTSLEQSGWTRLGDFLAVR
ncbi:hypothetical protein [Promicromonospora sp. MEB111]|uniref:hypothetical protein n=1 Tax=Promicromonospora sp. MEB111 TaxID=3040301 RepID=UPI00254D7DFD|nr:hypothetical protein [Promicromonospora sp. MEB111]